MRLRDFLCAPKHVVNFQCVNARIRQKQGCQSKRTTLKRSCLPVHQVIVPEMVHPCRQVAQDQDPLVLVQTEVVLGVVQEVEQGSA